MKSIFLILIILALSLGSCNHSNHSHDANDEHSHDTNAEHSHDTNTEHNHDTNAEQNHEYDDDSEQHEEHEESKFQYTGYSSNFEVFAEADPFVVGEIANVLAHFTRLPGFEPLEMGKVTASIQVDDNVSAQVLNSPSRKGIYSFNIQPETAGQGSLRFVIENESGTFEVQVPGITVFSNHQTAHEAAENVNVPLTNTTVFTKEQSWKIDFATQMPEIGPFGQVIKTTALVKPSVGSESVIVAKTGGIVNISSGNLLEGEEVAAGERLFTISGSSLAENNLSVRYAEAKNNFEKAKADYERMKALAEDQIISQRELLEARNQFANAEAVFDNLKSNFTSAGQSVSSPMTGFIKQVFVENGVFVEAGQPVLTVSQDKSLVLTADVAQRYSPALGAIVSANIRNTVSGKAYTLEELNGKILSYGKAANTNNFLIPVNMEIDNKGAFMPGSFVEVYLKTLSGANEITVPNTSLVEEQGNYFLWVQITPELFEKRWVIIGITDGINTQIEKGISPDERIVSRGATMIKLAQATGTLDAHSSHVH